MRFIPVVALVFSLNLFATEFEGEISNYRCWLATGVIPTVLQMMPQVFEISYATALAAEVRSANETISADWIPLFATTSAFSNSVALLATLSLVYKSANVDMTPGITTRDIKRRRLVELAYAGKTISTAVLQAAATYLAITFYSSVPHAISRFPSLLPTLITGTIALVISLLPPIGAVGLAINSCIQRRQSHLELRSDL